MLSLKLNATKRNGYSTLIEWRQRTKQVFHFIPLRRTDPGRPKEMLRSYDDDDDDDDDDGDDC